MSSGCVWYNTAPLAVLQPSFGVVEVLLGWVQSVNYNHLMHKENRRQVEQCIKISPALPLQWKCRPSGVIDGNNVWRVSLSYDTF